MSTTHISDLVTNIKNIVSSVLGQNYAELPFGYDITQNSKIVGRKGYAVLPLGTNEVESINRAFTIDQTYEIILNDVFLPSSTNDSSKRIAIITLYDLMCDIYKELVIQKAGYSQTLNIYNMTIGDPETYEDSDFVTLRMKVSIKHRYNF